VFGEELAAEVGRRHGAPVQMTQLKNGIFDEASISMIASDTVSEIGRLAGLNADVRRFRPNVVVRLLRSIPFHEDEWLGGVLSFGEGEDAAAITVTTRDVRCSIVNVDPESRAGSAEGGRSNAPEHRGNLRDSHSHRTTGGRTDHIPRCGNRERGTWLIRITTSRKPADQIHVL